MANENENNNTPWYQGAEGVDQEMVGHWQNKGWDVSDPAKLAIAASKSQREAERLIGARVDHDLVAVPKDPSKGDMNAVWMKLGKPAQATEYDFTSVVKKDGKALDEGFVTAARETAFKANMPKAAAVDFVKGVQAYFDAQEATKAAETSAKVSEEKVALAKNWGTTPELLKSSPFFNTAQAAIAKLGGDKLVAAVNALEGAVGYADVMNLFANIGKATGEHSYVEGNGKGVGENGLLTVDQAVARKNELKNDSAWVTKFLANDKDARREMEALDRIIVAGKQQ